MDNQAEVVRVNEGTADVRTISGLQLNNVNVAAPLSADKLKVGDVVALLWISGTPHITSILGHKGQRQDKYVDTEPPPPPANLQVVSGGSKLTWEFGGTISQRSDLSHYEVDAKRPGGAWGYNIYPVSEGKTEHFARLSVSVRCRVRAVDLRGNVSAWVVADDLLGDTVAPGTPTGMAYKSLSPTTILLSWFANPEPDLDHYCLEVSTSAGGVAVISESVSSNNYTITWSYAVTAYWRINAADKVGNTSGWTAWQQAETLQPASPELLNGTLEEGTGSPDNWTLNSASPVTTSWSTAQSYSPTHSVLIAVSPGSGAATYYTALLSDYVAVQQGVIYKLNCFTYTLAATANQFRLTVFQYRDASGTAADNPYRAFDLAENTSWDYGRSSQNFMLLPDDDDVAYIRVAIEVYLENTYEQSLYVDSFFMELYEIYQPGEGGGLMYHTDLLGVSADQHHNQVHVITGGDHTITGSQYQLVGLTGTDTIGLLTPSYNPSGASILRTDGSGYLTLVKLSTDTLADKSGGNMTIQPAGDLILNPGGKDILPNLSYDTNLGSALKKYLQLHAAELHVSTLVAENVIATIGGRVVVGPTTRLAADAGVSDTNIWLAHNEIARQDIFYLEARGNVEYMQHDALAIYNVDAINDEFEVAGDWTTIFTDGTKFTIAESDNNDQEWTCDGDSTYAAGYTTIPVVESVTLSSQYGYIYYTGEQTVGPYLYLNVERDLDGVALGGILSADAWNAGDAVLNTGVTGDGFIDIYSGSGIKSGSGPAIVGNIRQSLVYNEWLPGWAVGCLNGIYGYSGAMDYGVALGLYKTGKTWVSVDDSDGFRVNLGTGGTVLGKWDTSGNITVGDSTARHVYLAASGSLQMKNGSNVMIELNSDGDAIFGRTTGGNMMWDESESEMLFRGGTTTELKISSGGVLTAGASDELKISSDGLRLLSGGNTGPPWSAGDIAWLEGAVEVGGVSTGYFSGSPNYVQLFVRADEYASSDDVIVSLGAHSNASDAYVIVQADATVGANSYVLMGADSVDTVRVDKYGLYALKGLWIGSDVTAPDEDCLHLDGSIKKSTPIAVRAYRNTTQSIPDSAWTAIQLNATRHEYGGELHNPSTNNTRLTAPVAGLYAIVGQVGWVANATGQRQIRILHQGTTQIAMEGRIGASGSLATRMHVTTQYYLAASEYVELECWQDTGSGLNIASTSAVYPEFMMARIA